MEGGPVFKKLILHKQWALEYERDKYVGLHEALGYLLEFVPAEQMYYIMSVINWEKKKKP